MFDKFFKSFRLKIVFLFISSSLIAGGITTFIFYMLSTYYQNNAQYGDKIHAVRLFIQNTIGDFAFVSSLFVFFFTIVFLMLTNKYVKMLDDIRRGISQIARGNFDYKVRVRSLDTIGEIANDVNIASTNLKMAIQTGEYAKSSKDRLVVNIAHDLRTPLTSINGYLDLIINNKELSNEQILHYADISYNKSLQMERLIEQLFEFTRYNFGERKVNKDRIDLVYLINQITEEFYPVFKKNNLECRLNLGDEPAFILANGDMIVRVFDNLISNAIRYGISGKYIDISLSKSDKNVIVKVINYDSLIPKEDLNNIFESFYKVDKSRTSKTGGTGLGLAIAKNIVELHDGTIKASSSFEKTCFEVNLRLVE